MTAYADDLRLEDALRRYFDDNGFGSDGGYSARWVDFKLGPIPFPFPNTDSRRRAVRYHDLHHIVTGYQTDIIGEFEISAWELGSGCKDYFTAWQLNLGGLAGGALVAPLRTFRAFRRGRRSQNFYGRPYDDALLNTPVGVARRDLCVHAAGGERSTASDIALFLAASAAGLATGTLLFVAMLPVAVVAWPMLHMARRRSDHAMTPAS